MPYSPSSADVLLDTDSAAAYIGKSAKTLEKGRHDGRLKIPFYKIGHHVKYRLADLDRYLADCRVEPGKINRVSQRSGDASND